MVPIMHGDKPQLLAVDDDPAILDLLRRGLAVEGFNVRVAANGKTALRTLANSKIDVVVLDIMMPELDGFDVVKQIRSTSNVPVLFLSARKQVRDRISGLDAGGDDYLPKPFNPRELLARIKAILRRSKPQNGESRKLKLGDITLDSRTHRASVSATELALTGTEYEILRCLLETPGEVVSKENLSQRALGRRLLPYDRSVDTHISNLRGKLERAGNKNETIQNQRGVGYLLIPGS